MFADCIAFSLKLSQQDCIYSYRLNKLYDPMRNIYRLNKCLKYKQSYN